MNRRTLLASTAFGLAPSLFAGFAKAGETDTEQAPVPRPLPSASNADLSGDEIAQRVQAFYETATTFKATFKQRFFSMRGSAGSVFFEQPGKMSWRYTGSGNRVVSDGTRIRVYEKENKQLYELPLEKSQYGAALSFLSGQAKLTQTFRFTKQDAKRLRFASGHVLLAEPLQRAAAYERVLFYVEAQTYQVRRVLIVDAQGNRNRFDFFDPKMNTKPPAGEFAFDPPPGTRIIRP